MASSGAETDRKTKPALAKVTGKAKGKDGAKISADRKAIGAILRPQPEAQTAPAATGALRVGAKSDPAEAEADHLAQAIVSDKGKVAGKDKTPGKPKDDADSKDPAFGRAQARAPPTGVVHLPVNDQPRLVRRSADPSSQPNLDSLNTVPALPRAMAEVSVSAVEDSDLDEFAEGDFATVSEGEGVQPKYAPGRGGAGFSLPETQARLIRATRGGQPLTGTLRQRIEDRLAVDAAPLRLHTDHQAGQLCAALGARAFAYGPHIWLHSAADLADHRLIAHEAVHCAQQRALPRRRPASEPRRSRAPPSQQAPKVQRFLGIGDGLLARGAEHLADRVEAYGLIKAVSGRRLFTGETVPSGAMEFAGVFLRFVGQEEVYTNLQKSGALERGYREIRQGLDDHDLSWDRIGRTFRQAVSEFDLLSPIDSLMRVFRPFFADLRAFAVLAIKAVGRLIIEAFIAKFGPMGRAVWERILSIGDAIELIIDNPLGFAQNLIRAVARGIQGFGERIWDHIKKGFLAWILGPFAEMGVQLPARLDLRGVIGVILQVMGLTYPQLRPRIVKALDPHGEIKVKVVETIVEVVNILRTEGLAGLWRKILDYVQNLQMTVMNGIKDWVVTAVVKAGLRKLVAWSNPAGALIDILLTIYNLISFFIEKLQQILEFAGSVFDSLARIARGQLDDAARMVEATMARTIPIIISFLVSLIGLPDIAGTIKAIITALRARVHAAFDKMLKWIIDKVKKLIASLIERFARKTKPDRVPFQMDGDKHELWADSASGKTQIMMASDTPKELTPADGKTHLANVQKSADAALPGVMEKSQRAVTELGLAESMAAKMSAGKPPNREAPAARAKVKAQLEKGAEALQQNATKPAKAVEIDEDEVVKSGADKQTGLDYDSYPMRRCIRDTGKVEGAAGTYEFATGVYNEAKQAAPSPSDIYANLARDHIAEFNALKLISRIKAVAAMRAGRGKDLPLFDALHAALPSLDDKARNLGLPVLVVRNSINSAISTSRLAAGWGSHFDAAGDWWQPKAPAPSEADLRQTYGPAAVIADMQSHIDALITAYEGLPAGTMDADFGEHVRSKAVPVLKELIGQVFGQQPTAGAATSTAGAADGLNIPYAGASEKFELEVGKYEDLKVGDHFERHHIVERNITEKLRDRARALTLDEVLPGLADLAVTRAEAALPPDLLKGVKENEAGRTAIVDGLRGVLGATKASCGFSTGKDPGAKGVAVVVLASVNRDAGTQTDSIDGKLGTAHGAVAARQMNGVAAALSSDVTELLKRVAKGTLPRAGTIREGLQQGCTTAEPSVRPALSEQWKGVLRDLTSTSHQRFKQLQQASIDQIESHPINEPMRKALQSRLDTRAGTGRFVDENEMVWFGA